MPERVVIRSRLTLRRPRHWLAWLLVAVAAMMLVAGLVLVPGVLVAMAAPGPVAAVVGPLLCPADSQGQVVTIPSGRRGTEVRLRCHDASGQVVADHGNLFRLVMGVPMMALLVVVGARLAPRAWRRWQAATR